MPIKYTTIGRLEIRLSKVLNVFRMGRRVWNLTNVKFVYVTSDNKEMLTNNKPSGLYINVNDINQFIKDNMNGNLV